MTGHAAQIAAGERFAFGANWTRFLRRLTEDRIVQAERSLLGMLERETLAGLSFLDIGCGSGLFSLAARRLGARVRSFDFDPQSVACAVELRERFFAGDPEWVISEGSALDEGFMRSLGTYDIVYSWGVLHHTGNMWAALELAIHPVCPGGKLYIAVYNHQVYWTRFYGLLKRAYVRAPLPGRVLLAGAYAAGQVVKGLLKDLAVLRNPLRRYRQKIEERGMSMWHDWIDWIGGYPFEVAKPEEVFDFCRRRGLVLCRLVTCGGGQGCNEYVFTRPT